MRKGFGDMTVVYLDCSAGYTALCVCENSHNCTPKAWIFLYVIKKERREGESATLRVNYDSKTG